jgi:hypothetical protein
MIVHVMQVRLPILAMHNVLPTVRQLVSQTRILQAIIHDFGIDYSRFWKVGTPDNASDTIRAQVRVLRLEYDRDLPSLWQEGSASLHLIKVLLGTWPQLCFRFVHRNFANHAIASTATGKQYQ